MPKVVHLTRRFHPQIGGVETHIAGLDKELKADGFDVCVVTTRNDNSLKLYEKGKSEDIYRLNTSLSIEDNLFSKTKYKLQIWRQLWQLRKIWMSADIIQIHDVFFWILPFYPLVSNKVFMTFHGYEGDSLPSWRSKFWHELASLFSKGNICIGNFHQKWFGVDADQISFGAVQLIKVPKTKKKSSELIYVGRLENDNGIMQIVNALKILKEKGKEYHLDVFGDGSLKSKAERFCHDHKLDVEFHGFHPEARLLLSKYKLAFVSRYLSIIEALSVKTKVIAYSHNLLTNDYLFDAPFTRWIKIVKNQIEIVDYLQEDDKISDQAYDWARQQTFGKLKDQYTSLWQMKK